MGCGGRSWSSCGLVLGLSLGSAVLTLVGAGCQQRRQRPSAVLVSKEQPGGGDSKPRGGGTEGGGGTGTRDSGGAGKALDYLTPVPRPGKISVGSGNVRDTNEHDIFVTPVHVKDNAWFKSCVIGSVGSDSARQFGCSQAETPRLGSETKLEARTSFGIPLSSGGQKIVLELWSYKPEVKKCSEIPDKQDKSTTESCPGSLAQDPFAKRKTSEAKQHFLCTRISNTLVLAYEDQESGRTASGELGLFDKYRTAKEGLTMKGGGQAWIFPDVRKLFSSEVTAALFQKSDGTEVSEGELRAKYGVDFTDVIVQVDLGSSGNALAGFEDCK